MTATITTAAAAAANRAHLLADLIDQRALLHPARDVMAQMATQLRTAAQALTTEPTPYSNTVPGRAGIALLTFQGLAMDHPATGVSDHLAYYVTAAVSRSVPAPAALNPVSKQLAGQEASLRVRIDLATAALDEAADDDAREYALESLMTLHRLFDRLAAAVVIDNNLPCNRR